MAAKKKFDIAKKLNALNPSVPTRTRSENIVPADDQTETRQAKPAAASEKTMNALPPLGSAEIWDRNFSVVEELRNSALEDAFRFQGLFFESWSKSFKILSEAFSANMEFAGRLYRGTKNKGPK